ncbi:MAG: NAD(P)H-hydrate dehydratase [Pseudomonadota bacterium]
MTELLTAAQMRAIERTAIAGGAVSGLELMERAGRGVVEAILAEWPDLGAAGALPRTPGYWDEEEAPERRRAVVLCGPGNNGGDGFVVARLLKERGWAVEVFLCGDPERLPPDARANHERWRAMGAVAPLDGRSFAQRVVPARCDLVIDALFGTGLARPVDLPLGALAPAREEGAGRRVVAIDLPSGIDSDSGRVIGDAANCVMADLTVTLHALKLGHVLAAGPEHAHRVRLRDIGLGPGAARPATPAAVTLAAPDRTVAQKRPDHKYGHGHALILSGPSGRGGAGRLAARGALRIGAGLVTLGCPPEAIPENAARLDSVMLRAVTDGDALAAALADRRINAFCLGPGMGTGAREAGLVAAALASARATVLDADALTLLARDPALFAALHDRCVLTPHAGEFARLFPDIAERLAAPAPRGPAHSKVDATRAAAARAGCVVLFKGPDTVIADPSGRCAVHAACYERAAPWLATAGSGDVLAGFITGLLARGFDPMPGAETAAWLHAECARRFGPGLIAEDLPEQVPGVLRDLGAGGQTALSGGAGAFTAPAASSTPSA